MCSALTSATDERSGRTASEAVRGGEPRLKKLLAEAMLDNAVLKDITARKW